MKISSVSRNAAVILLLMSAKAIGQETPINTIDVIPRTSDAFLLTSAVPSVSRPIVIDAAKRVDVMVSALAQDLDVTLISPKRARYSVGQTRQDFESWVTVVDGVGASYRAILTNPLPGTWTLEVGAKKLTSDIDVVVNVLFDSEVFVALVAGEVDHRVGSVAALSLAAFEGSARLRGVTVNAILVKPDGSTVPVVFRDDGAEADITANDGLYASLIELPVEGEYRVKAGVAGMVGSRPFQRTAFAQLRATRPSATLGGTFIDGVVDDDSDGLFDAITVAPAINVAETGTYRVSVRLRSGTKIVQKSATVDLAAGLANPVVRVPAEDVRLTFIQDGPYAVDLVLLERREPTEVVFVDRRSDLGMTQPHRLRDLQHERTRISPLVTAVGFDTNGNGRFDQLRATVDVEIEIPGSYSCSGALTDRNQDGVADAHLDATFGVGTNRFILVFDGGAVGQHGGEGRYILRVDMFGPTSSAGADARFKIGPFNVAQFEGAIPDTTPPSLDVSVTPTELWPPNGRMVEIVPTVQVNDDRDPAPVAKLQGITGDEDDWRLRDDSPDMRVDEDGRIFLRAERFGKREGRTYTLTWSARDSSGNTIEKSAFVRVPHDKGP